MTRDPFEAASNVQSICNDTINLNASVVGLSQQWQSTSEDIVSELERVLKKI